MNYHIHPPHATSILKVGFFYCYCHNVWTSRTNVTEHIKHILSSLSHASSVLYMMM